MRAPTDYQAPLLSIWNITLNADMSREKSTRSYSPPELTEYGKVAQLTEQGYGRGPPDEVPPDGGRGPRW